MHIYIINGPNLNMLGVREPEHYGTFSYGDLTKKIEVHANKLGMKTTIMQSNYEGEIVEMIQRATQAGVDGIVINPAAFSHYSIAILDALLCFSGPKIEVHLSDVENREDFRRVLITAKASDVMISGQAYRGYLAALDEMKRRLNEKRND